MRKIVKFLFIALIFSGCCEDDVTPDPIDDGYRLDHILNFRNSTDEEPYSMLELQYNDDGLLEKESLFDMPQIVLTTYSTYEYNGDKVIKKSNYGGSPGNLALGTYVVYEYDGDKLVKEGWFRGDGSSIYTTHYKFSGNNLTETYKVSSDLGVHHHYKYIYNLLNTLVREEAFMYDEVMESITKYFYDNNRRVIRTEMYDHISSLTSIIETSYNGDGGLPSEKRYLDVNGSLLSKHLLIYDNNDNLMETDVVVGNQTNALFRKKFEGKRLIEDITYAPTWGFTEWYVTRYEYSLK